MDGKLTQAEFAIAVYLVEQVRDGHQVPAALPPGPFPPTYLQQPQPPPPGLSLGPPSLPQSPVAPPPPLRGPAGGSAARLALDFSASGASPLAVPSSPKMWSSGVPSAHPSSASHPRPSHQPQHTPSAVSASVPVSSATTPSFDPHSFDASFDPLPPSASATITAPPIAAAASSVSMGGADHNPQSLFTAGGVADENLFSADYGAATPPPPVSRALYESKLPDIDPGLVNQLAPEQQARIREERGGAAAADEELRARHTATLDAKAKEQFYRWVHGCTPHGMLACSQGVGCSSRAALEVGWNCWGKRWRINEMCLVCLEQRHDASAGAGQEPLPV